jgi:hypothetical protein
MILAIGDIKIRVDIEGDDSSFNESSLMGPFARFLLEDTNCHFSLSIYPASPRSSDANIPEDIVTMMNGVVRSIEERFPFTGIPWHRDGGLTESMHRCGMTPDAVTFFSRALDRYAQRDISIVPHDLFIVAVDHEEKRGVCFLTGEGKVEPRTIFSLVLQCVISLIAAENGGLLLHAGSAKINGAGRIFLGNSGSGKSSIAISLQSEDVLSDDGTLYLVREDRHSIFPTPFSQVLTRTEKKAGIPLGGVFFLIQDREDFIIDLPPGVAMVRILHNHIHFFRFLGSKRAEEAFRVAEGLTRRVPSFELHFTRRFDPPSFFREQVYEG